MNIRGSRSSYLTVQVPPWDSILDHPTANMHSSSAVSPNGGNDGCFDFSSDCLTSLRHDIPSGTDSESEDVVSDRYDFDILAEEYSSDQFRMFDFKVKKCVSRRSHDWTECPYSHWGEKARRRDPRKYHYSATPCTEMKNSGRCRDGDSCEFAHGVFETWLHPERYRTQPCRDGTMCTRRVCFFAHTVDQIRVIPDTESYIGSTAPPFCNSSTVGDSGVKMKGATLGLSPTSVLHLPITMSSLPTEPLPESPSGLNSMSGITLSMHNLWIENLRRCMGSLEGAQMASGFSSPESSFPRQPATTPTQIAIQSVSSSLDFWEKGYDEEEPVMERVESGRDLRAKMYAKLIHENSLDSACLVPDFGWISELLE